MSEANFRFSETVHSLAIITICLFILALLVGFVGTALASTATKLGSAALFSLAGVSLVYWIERAARESQSARAALKEQKQ